MARWPQSKIANFVSQKHFSALFSSHIWPRPEFNERYSARDSMELALIKPQFQQTSLALNINLICNL